jgi:hypothetical protein
MRRTSLSLPVLIAVALALVAPAEAGTVRREGSPVTHTVTRTTVTRTVTGTFTGTIFTETSATSTTATTTTSTTTLVACDCPPTANSPTVSARVCHCPVIRAPRGYIAGRVVDGKHHRPADNWRVLVLKRHHARRVEVIALPTMHTSPSGAFSMSLSPGTYTIGAERPNGKLCGARTVRVIDRKTVHAVLRCR